jgi:hypothetical protein
MQLLDFGILKNTEMDAALSSETSEKLTKLKVVEAQNIILLYFFIPKI